MHRVDFKNLPWESPLRGLRFKALKFEGRQLRLVEYAREMEPHWCENGHIGYILEGTFEIQFDREVQVYQAGDGVFIPSGPEHRHKAKVLSEIVKVVFVEEV